MSRGDDLTGAWARLDAGQQTADDAKVFGALVDDWTVRHLRIREATTRFHGHRDCGDRRCAHGGCVAVRVLAALDG